MVQRETHCKYSGAERLVKFSIAELNSVVSSLKMLGFTWTVFIHLHSGRTICKGVSFGKVPCQCWRSSSPCLETKRKAGAPLKAGGLIGPGGALKWGHSPAGPSVFPVHPGVSPVANFLQSFFPLCDWSLALFLQPFSSSSHQFLLAACRVSRWPKLRHEGSTG